MTKKLAGGELLHLYSPIIQGHYIHKLFRSHIKPISLIMDQILKDKNAAENFFAHQVKARLEL
jgi:hypothetical protein